MSGAAARPQAGTAKAVAWRGFWLLVLWLVVTGTAPADLPVGIVVAALGAWGSLTLLPPANRRIRTAPLVRCVLALLRDSVLAGADVAARALTPRVNINPGFVRYRPAMASGPGRTLFVTMMSLVPGSLPAGTEPDGTLIVHCLDIGQPVAANLRRDEAKWQRVSGGDGEGG